MNVGAMTMVAASQQMRRYSMTDSKEPEGSSNSIPSININGFIVEFWDESLVRRLFKIYPDTALNVQSQDPELRTYYMNLLLDTIRMLGRKRCLSDVELSTSSKSLHYLTQAGFKVEWLCSKLEMAYLERKKRDACEARIVELKQELKKLELSKSGLKAELKNEKAKLNPRSFRSFFCLKT